MPENEVRDLNWYADSYEREHEKALLLAAKLADAERKNEELEGKLNRIKGSIFWKLSLPVRGTVHFFVRNLQRVGLYGSVGGVASKIKSKSIERKARKQHGTRSFPNEEERKRQQEESFEQTPLISILTPLYNTPIPFLQELLSSVQAQTYSNWELCLADGSDGEHAQVGKLCMEKAEADPRIKYQKLSKNTGISGNTNACYQMAKGDFIGLLDHDDLLHPSVLYEYVKAINEKKADYLYCDECTFHGNVDRMITLHFKPDFSPDNLHANNYICHFSVFSRQLLEGEELFRSRFDGSQDHDMILRLTGHARHIVHIPKLMYYWRSHKGSTAKDIDSKSYAIEAARGAIADHLTQCGFRDFEILPTKAFETIFRIRYKVLGNPMISILIPNRDHVEDLRRCVSSILEKSSYDNYEILILENGSTDPGVLEYYESLKENPVVRILEWKPEEEKESEKTTEKSNSEKNKSKFNYSSINNFGAENANGDFILLLNNDTEVISLNWMEELLMYAQRPDVGAAGAKLYYPDKTIQHAGIVLGLGAHRSAGHTHYKVASTNLGYMGRLCYAQDVSAVTGACLMVKKALWDEVGGLDESFRISLNDVDFCMKLRRLGYLNVWNPYCELYHYESASRGADTDPEKAARYEEECARFRERYAKELEEGDPYYNVNFSLDRSDYTLKM